MKRPTKNEIALIEKVTGLVLKSNNAGEMRISLYKGDWWDTNLHNAMVYTRYHLHEYYGLSKDNPLLDKIWEELTKNLE